MKKINFLIFCLIFSNVYAQEISEKEIRTTVSEVTVFIKGAQVTRKKSVNLLSGKTILKFVGLSPFIDAKSIQVKAEGEITVLSVNHQQDFMDKLDKPVELVNLEKKLQDIKDKIELENTYLSILKEEIAFLQENRSIGGKNQELSVTNLKETFTFYGTKLTSLKLKVIERNKTVSDLTKKKNDLEKQIRSLTSKKEYPPGKVLIKIDSKGSTKATFEISYLVGNAGWFPSYDIRAKNIQEPIELIYKANVRQDTKIDWKDVKLRFSSADPDISGIRPELKTYFLNYNTLPPAYNHSLNRIKGIVFNRNKEPLPGVNVIVQGTTIGSVTDLNGNYSITIPNNAGYLTYSFIGFKSKTLPITNSVMNVILEEDALALNEVVAATPALQGRVPGVSMKKGKANVKIRGASSMAIPTAQVQKQISVDFEIKVPYTVKSDNKSYAIDMDAYALPAEYQYFSVPKVKKGVFLIANITDWEKFSLLEGEANVFFEGTFIGKTLLDVRYASDTLQISLGQDKNVSVSREKIKDFTTKKFIGNKKEETKAWMTRVKNNKDQEINIRILDQVPVSTLEEIEVKIQKDSGAKHDAESGEIKWEFTLNPGEIKELELRYSVKYPKNRNLFIE